MPDVITVVEQIPEAWASWRADGLAFYLGALAHGRTPAAAGVRAYAELVRERSLLRQLIPRVTRSLVRCSIRKASLRERSRRPRGSRCSRSRKPSFGGPRYGAVLGASHAPLNCIDKIDEAQPEPGCAQGHADRLRRFRSLHWRPLRAGDLVIVRVARRWVRPRSPCTWPSTRRVNPKPGSVCVFSMEMPTEQLMTRRVGIARPGAPRITSHRMVTGEAGAHHQRDVADVRGSAIFIDETPGLSPMDLRARARRVKRERWTRSRRRRLPAADAGAGNKENRTYGNLRNLTRPEGARRELHIAVIALSQPESRRRTA